MRCLRLHGPKRSVAAVPIFYVSALAAGFIKSGMGEKVSVVNLMPCASQIRPAGTVLAPSWALPVLS